MVTAESDSIDQWDWMAKINTPGNQKNEVETKAGSFVLDYGESMWKLFSFQANFEANFQLRDTHLANKHASTVRVFVSIRCQSFPGDTL